MRALILNKLINVFSKKTLLIKPILNKFNGIHRLQSTYLPEVYELRHLPTASNLYSRILSNDLKNLVSLFTKHKFELRIAGGAVRDILMGIEPHDVDLATNALPEQMLEMFNKENIRIYNQNGIKHGTVTVRINDRSNYEITTLRIDVNCYGRHAEVEFTNDWHADAIRRDLTVNALFLGFDCKIYDYVNGYNDLRNNIVKFVGVADKRVKEDYLRILRYFRFFSKVSNDPNKHDENSIKAIKDNVEGLGGISSERKAMELRKILSQKFSDTFMKMFYELNIARYAGLPKNGNVGNYARFYRIGFHGQNKPSPMTFLFALMNNKNDITETINELKLSKAESYVLYALEKYVPILEALTINGENRQEVMEFFRREFARAKSNVDRSLKKTELIEIAKYCNKSYIIEEAIDDINQIPKFELTHTSSVFKDVTIFHPLYNERFGFFDLLEMRMLRVNRLLADLREKWIDSNFTMSHEKLVNSLDDATLTSYLNLDKKKKK